MTDWWRTQYPQIESEGLLAVSERPEEPVRPSPPPSPPSQPTREEPEPVRRNSGSRSKLMKIAGGVAGVALAGALAVNSASAGNASEKPPASSEQTEDLPAAGGGPGTQPSAAEAPQGTSAALPQETVTLTASPSGKGRVGVVVKVSISNNTNEALTILATLVEGDGRPAIVGEGTLAPGSTVVQPGETTEGTVEFSSGKPPGQVVLLDLSGNIIATSEQG